MRCSATVPRRRCSRPAVWRVTITASEDVRFLCTQHKNKSWPRGDYPGVIVEQVDRDGNPVAEAITPIETQPEEQT